MDSRDRILNRLRKQARATGTPGIWHSRRNYEDLAAQFTAALTAGGGEVHRAHDLEEAWFHLGTVLEEINARTAFANNHRPLDGIDLAARYPAVDWIGHDSSHDDFKTLASTADIGISGADAALAETGTIAVSSGPGRSRLASLLPPVHVALAPTSCLTTDIFTWLAGRGGDWPAALTLISGPSKTSDIEQTLVTGVHGPGRFIVILYQNRGA